MSNKLSLEGLDFQATKIDVRNNILTITQQWIIMRGTKVKTV